MNNRRCAPYILRDIRRPMSARLLTASLASLLCACAAAPAAITSADFPAEAWSGAILADAPYLLAPGDRLEVIVHTAPELSRELVIAPDGRIHMPLAGSVMAMALTPDELATLLRQALCSELIDPDLDVVATEFASQKVFVGGEVAAPGMFDLPGQIDPYQAIVMAGGLTREAQASNVLLIRRLPGGEVRSTLIDVRAGLSNPGSAGWLPLRRFDVLYVPRSRIAEQNQFAAQYIRDALPLPFSLFYAASSAHR
jgi:polysaccharide export outer membrane protein